MKNVIIIHGRPDKEEYLDPTMPKPVDAHWIPWLKKQLEERGYIVHVPAMPEPYEPDYEKWKEEFEKIPINSETILIGHSRGGAFILHWLSDHEIKVGKVLLIAPSITPNHPIENGFSEFQIDSNLVNKTNGIVMFYSSDDEEGIIESAEKIKSTINNIDIREFTNKGHFTSDDGVSQFPEILEEIKL